MLVDLTAWLAMHARTGAHLCLKRLSGTDTLAVGTLQSGVSVPKRFQFALLPRLNRSEVLNPDAWFDLFIDSHDDYRRARAVWYNSKFHSGRRDETRVSVPTIPISAIQDEESTGALVVFSFSAAAPKSEPACHVWVCRNASDEALAENIIGPIEPGRCETVGLPLSKTCDASAEGKRWDWRPELNKTPTRLFGEFPSDAEGGQDSLAHAIDSLPPDMRLTRRIACEERLDRSFEAAVDLPRVERGFKGVDTAIAFVRSIMQRREARWANALQSHARLVLREEGLVEGRHFAPRMLSPWAYRPDFVFPTDAAYLDPTFPPARLRVLAMRTTCTDCWRQLLDQIRRPIRWLHLLTVQDEVSESQYREMAEFGVRLVVPAPLHSGFPKSIQSELQTLGDFIDEVRQLGNEPHRAD